MLKKNKKNLPNRKKDPFLELQKKVSFNEDYKRSKRTIITPSLFKDKKNKDELSKMISNNIFREDEYYNLSFCKVKAVKTVFAFCDLRGCDFSEATLSKCDFSFADLRDCNFSNAVMRECSFRHARFKNTVFSGADDFLCDFQGVILN